MPFPFLPARWENLCLLQYAVPAELAADRVPKGMEADRLDGQAFVSVVPFQFRGVHVLGVPWPGFTDFDELNLRHYVRRRLPDGSFERGVVFVREFVPQSFVAWVARTIYHEPYRAAPFRHNVIVEGDPATGRRTAVAELDWEGRTHRITVRAEGPAFTPGEGSVEHFFKEHTWGYGKTRGGEPIRYRVEHPVWRVWPVTGCEVDLDFASIYGPEWGFLTGRRPHSVVFAEGSPIKVFPKGRL
jgi:hypothetical protein